MSARKRFAAARREWSDPWEVMPERWKAARVAEFQTALQRHLPSLADASLAERELRALLNHEPIETVRRSKAKAEIKKIRRLLEKIAVTDGANFALHELFHRRHENEHLAPVVECVFMLQLWHDGEGSSIVLDQFENEAAAEIDAMLDQGSIKWAGVWAVGALVALWERRRGRTWKSNSVNWEGRRSRGAYLRDGYGFLAQAVKLEGAVESAFTRWVSLNLKPKMG